MWCLGRASQSDGCLAPPPAVRHGRVLCGRPWDWQRPWTLRGHVDDTSSNSNERLEIARCLIRKNKILSRFDYGDATFLSGTHLA